MRPGGSEFGLSSLLMYVCMNVGRYVSCVDERNVKLTELEGECMH